MAIPSPPTTEVFLRALSRAAAKLLKDRVAAAGLMRAGALRLRAWPDFMISEVGLPVPGGSCPGSAWRGRRRRFRGAGGADRTGSSRSIGIELVLEAHEQYWRKVPSVKRLVLKSVPDETTRLAMLKRSEADVVYLLQGELAEDVRRTPGLTLRPVPIVSTHWLVFVDQWDAKSPWADRRVRLAANHAINRQAINEAITGYSDT
jgi:peptide/nickel transport system substrate-binding protein